MIMITLSLAIDYLPALVISFLGLGCFFLGSILLVSLFFQVITLSKYTGAFGQTSVSLQSLYLLISIN